MLAIIVTHLVSVIYSFWPHILLSSSKYTLCYLAFKEYNHLTSSFSSLLESSRVLWFADGDGLECDPSVVSFALLVFVLSSFVPSVTSFTSAAVSPSPPSSSSSSSQLSLTAAVFSAAFLARALARFFAFLLGGGVTVLALGCAVAEGATQPSMCPLGSAVESIACWRDPRKRDTSSCGVNPGLILSCLRKDPSDLLDSGITRSSVRGSTAMPAAD